MITTTYLFYHNHNYHVFHFELEYLVQTQVIIPTVVVRAIYRDKTIDSGSKLLYDMKAHFPYV